MMVRIGGLIASAVVVLGSFLPWASIDVFGISETVMGMDGDGAISLFIGIAMAVLFGLAKRGTVIAAAAVSLLALGLGIFEFMDLKSASDDLGGLADVAPGIGLFMIVAGGIAGIVFGVLGMRNTPASATPAGGTALPWSQQQAQGQAAAWGQQPAQGQAAAWGQQQAQAPAWGQSAQPQAAQPQYAQPQPTPQVAQQAPAAQAQPQPPAGTPAGWLADPYGQAQLRYWDGARWTEHTHNQPQG